MPLNAETREALEIQSNYLSIFFGGEVKRSKPRDIQPRKGRPWGVSLRAYTNYENDAANLPLRVIKLICERYEVPIEWFVFGKPRKRPSRKRIRTCSAGSRMGKSRGFLADALLTAEPLLSDSDGLRIILPVFSGMADADDEDISIVFYPIDDEM